MSKKYDPKTCDLSFVEGTVYKDLRSIGENAYRDIKMSLTLGTASDLVFYLKKHSKLLKGYSGNEIAESLNIGMLSHVYLLKDGNGNQLVVKRSHDGMLPLQIFKNIYVPIPRWLVGFFFSEYGVKPDSLKRDVYDYEKIVKPYWGKERDILEGEKFTPYLNMALYMVDHFLPEFGIKDIYKKSFWQKLMKKKKHKNLGVLKKYLRKIETQKNLIPREERFILYDGFSNSLHTIFIQDAKVGSEEILPGKQMVFPYELIAAGKIPKEMPKIMIEHLLRTVESFVSQLDLDFEIKKVPDYRPLEVWKIMPPTPFEIFVAETSNLVAHKNKQGELNITFVDTHLLLEPESNLFYRWTEKRFWISMFLNIRFWVRKALEFEG